MSIPTWRKLAEERISQAIKEGQFENLPGAGKPLDLTDDSNIPEELRMAHKLLKNAGFTPPEVETRNEILRTEDLLASAPDEKARYAALRKLNYLTMKLGMLRPRSAALDEHEYALRVAEKLARRKKT